jgi:ComF family protein
LVILRYHALPAIHSYLLVAEIQDGGQTPRMRSPLKQVFCSTGFRQVTKALEDTFMPSRCAFCGTRSRESEADLCSGCFDDLPWNEMSCDRCARPLVTALPENVHCADCQLRPPPFAAAVAPLLYSFPVDAAIKAMKFRRKFFYAPAFGSLLERSLPALGGEIDALLPVPLHWRRHALRGFNQAEELCKVIKKMHRLPLLRNVIRKRATPSQSGLSAKQRRRNLRAAFAVRGKIQAKHVLIVDDVITTGETCRHLATALLGNGVQKVSVLAVARAGY